MEKPVTFSHETLHSVANHLAVIVSYSNLILMSATGEQERSDLAEIRTSAYAAAELLQRPLARTD